MFSDRAERRCVNGSYHPTILQAGMYVVVALDPVASVRCLDAEAHIAAREMKPKQYLALIRPSYGWFDETDASHYELDLFLVGQGFPNHEAYGRDESMSIPIYPTKEHPMHRPPLRPSPPLPWPNCYQYTRVREAHVHTGRIITSDNSVTSVSESDIDKFCALSDADVERGLDQELVMAPESSQYSVFDSETEDSDVNSSYRELGSDASVPQSIETIDWIMDHPQGVQPTFDIWLDLTVLTEINDPIGAKKEVTAINSLRRDYEEREKLKNQEMRTRREDSKTRTEMWAQAVTCVENDDPGEPQLQPVEEQRDQDLIMIKEATSLPIESGSPVEAPGSLPQIEQWDQMANVQNGDTTQASLSYFRRGTAAWRDKLRIARAWSKRQVGYLTAFFARGFGHWKGRALH